MHASCLKRFVSYISPDEDYSRTGISRVLPIRVRCFLASVNYYFFIPCNNSPSCKTSQFLTLVMIHVVNYLLLCVRAINKR